MGFIKCSYIFALEPVFFILKHLSSTSSRPRSRLGSILGRLGAILGPSLAVLGPCWGHVGPSWGPYRAIKPSKNYGFSYTFGLFPLSYPYPLSWAILKPTWPVLKPSWGHLGAVLGRLGAVLGRSWAALGPSWAILGLSWAVLGSC